jgi:RHS repeat-associated protein
MENSGRMVEYSYDELDRLVQEKITDPINGNLTLAYNYDAVSNRVSLEVDGVTYAYSYDANNRLLSAGDRSYAYDANGNTLSQTGPTGSINYGYDFKNQLVSASTSEDSVVYAYDAGGIRVSRSVNGAMTRYLVDQNRPYAQVLEEQTDNSVASYTFGDDLLSQKRGTENRYFHYDRLGSTRHLTDESETVTDAYDYQAFGEPLSVSGDTVNPYLFTGEQHDPETGLVYLRARYYDPGVGRFLTRDTWQGRRGEPITLHKYLYANGNPVVFVDPTGHDPSLMSLSVTLTIRGMLRGVSAQVRRNILKQVTRKRYSVFRGKNPIKGFERYGNTHWFVYVEKKIHPRGWRFDFMAPFIAVQGERRQFLLDMAAARDCREGHSYCQYDGRLFKTGTSRQQIYSGKTRLASAFMINGEIYFPTFMPGILRGRSAQFSFLQYLVWQSTVYSPHRETPYVVRGTGGFNCQTWTVFAIITAKVLEKIPFVP